MGSKANFYNYQFLHSFASISSPSWTHSVYLHDITHWNILILIFFPPSFFLTGGGPFLSASNYSSKIEHASSRLIRLSGVWLIRTHTLKGLWQAESIRTSLRGFCVLEKFFLTNMFFAKAFISHCLKLLLAENMKLSKREFQTFTSAKRAYNLLFLNSYVVIVG